MNKILSFFIAILFICSCAKDESVIFDLNITPDEISKVELHPDHKILLPNGISKIEFHPFVYAKRKMLSYNRDDETDEFYAKEVEEEFLVPADQIPNGCLKVYDQAGNELEDNTYSTTTEKPGSVLQFYAKAGDVKSNNVDITIRELPDEAYDEIVVPVVFHLLLPPATSAPGYDVSVEFLEQQLQKASDIFNRRITTDPNAGNAKITFKLALYGPNGAKLQEPGKNVENISASDFEAMGTSATKTNQYLKYILAKKSRIIWDPTKYLNIWLATFTTSTSTYGTTTSFRVLPPTVMHSDYDLSSIPGLDLVQQDEFTLDDVTDCREVGFMVNFRAIFMPSSVQGRNEFSLATVIGAYYGLLFTDQGISDDWVDGDNDFCPDTYYYYSGSDYSPSMYKNNRLYEENPDGEYEWFTSFNIMDTYSRKNSVSVDQAKRLRKVLKQCSSRWAYKSDWAFTGQ